MKWYDVYYRERFLGHIYRDEITIKGYRIFENVDNKIKYIVTTIKDNKIWIKRYDKWLQSERIKKLKQLGL